ncbi:MAG: hypothetical protein PHS79_00160 [Patescibacteria group bacterium]|nr:hypothetical protein [Patescibacteria group bacterium]
MNLLTLNFWFQMQPPMFVYWVGLVMLVVFAAMSIIGLAAKIYVTKAGMDKLMKRAVGRAGTMLLTMGLFGLALYGFVYESVPILSMRAWLLVWLICLGVWVWSILRYVRVEIPAKKEMAAERERMNKWLPKKK